MSTESQPGLRLFKAESLEAVVEKFKGAFDVKTWPDIVAKVYKDIAGDPQTMIATQYIRLQNLPYWNPTKHRINIHALGIVKTLKRSDSGKRDWKGEPVIKDEKVEFEEFVEPGHTIGIPYTYTIGGKHSSLKGVAPQLQPLPTQYLEWFGEDLLPTSYAEWVTYTDPGLITKCCDRPMGWNVKTHRLVCSKCGKSCVG